MTKQTVDNRGKQRANIMIKQTIESRGIAWGKLVAPNEGEAAWQAYDALRSIGGEPFLKEARRQNVDMFELMNESAGLFVKSFKVRGNAGND